MTDRRTLDGLVRRAALPELSPPPPTGDLDAWLAETRTAVRTARRATQRELGTAEAILHQGEASADGWRAVEQATQRLEQELVKNGTLRTRLDQGRRSLMPKVEERLEAAAQPDISVEGGRMVGGLGDEGVAALHRESSTWTESWVAYVYGWVDADLADLVQVLWSPRAGDLPVPAPTVAPLNVSSPGTKLNLPEIRIVRDKVGWGAGFRHVRSVLYAILSMGLIFGLRDKITGTILVMIPVGLAALAFGFVQARSEQVAAGERLENEVRRRAETVLASALRSWLDRQADKIVADAQQQLLERRATLVAWYRSTVVPARARWDREAAQRRQQVDEARRQKAPLESRLRTLQQLEAALKASGA